MARVPVRFRQADVRRAVAGTLAAGLTVERVEVEADRFIVHTAKPDAADAPKSPLDEWRAARDSR